MNEKIQERFIDLTEENLADEHICCIIRTKKAHPGIEAKKQWLAQRLKEGHTFRKLDVKGTVFIEYAPLETAWAPIYGENYLYIYCLWVLGEYRGKGYAKALMESCIADAKAQRKSGICMLAAQKQKAWLSDQSFAKSFGFQVVDTTEYGYELLALSFDGSVPSFAPTAKSGTINTQELTVYYDMQCPYVVKALETVRQYCEDNNIPASFVLIDSLEKAKSLPCVFNNWAVFWKGEFQTVNLLDIPQLKRIVSKS